MNDTTSPFIAGQLKQAKQLRLVPIVQELPTLFTFLELYCNQNQLKQHNLYRIKLVSEEIFLNIVNHSQTENDIFFAIGHDDCNIHIQFEDSGIPFNPCTHEKKTKNNCIDDIQIGGLGIIMMKKMSNSIYYQRNKNSNLLYITLNIKD